MKARTDTRRDKCPYCYAYSPRRGGAVEECDDCLRRFRRVKIEDGTRFSVGGQRYRITEWANHVVYPIRHSFAYESFRHPDIETLRRKYALLDITKPYADEFTQQLAVRDWICAAWPAGHPSVSGPGGGGPDPDIHVGTMLTKARTRGNIYFCTYKAMAGVELASAFGWTGRLVNIMQHMVYEIWSNQLNKWVLFDSLYNTHYEKRGVPLSVSEIRLEHMRNGARYVDVMWGVPRFRLGPAQCSAYEWFAIYMHNNFFDFPPGDHMHPLVVPRDRYNKGKHWRQGKQQERRRGDKYISKGMAHEESDPRHIDYPINQTEIMLVRGKDGLIARFHHSMPNFGRMEVRTGSGRWRRFDRWREAEIDWRLKAGRNQIQARCVNTLGVCGPTSSVTLSS